MSANSLSIIQSLGLPKPDPRMVMVYNIPPGQSQTTNAQDCKSQGGDRFIKSKATPHGAKMHAPKITPELKADVQKKLHNGEPVDMYVVLKGIPKSKIKNADLVQSMEMKTYKVDPDTLVVHNRMIPKNARPEVKSTNRDEPAEPATT